MSSTTNILEEQSIAAERKEGRKQKQNKHNYVTTQGTNLKASELILCRTECPEDLLNWTGL